MLDFTQDITEAGILYEEYGYKINAIPITYEKNIQGALSLQGYKSNFPSNLLNNKCNIAINHYLSDTLALDIDDIQKTNLILKNFNLNAYDLITSTMTFQGQNNHYKLIFKKHHNYKLDFKSLYTSQYNAFSLKGYELSFQLSKFNNDLLGNYFDLLPPSVIPSLNIKYKFITQILPKDKLPVMPTELLELWQNFDNLKTEFNSILV